ncbi:MAG TPA: hypothetical protein VFM75_12210, partial [Modicisalibacter sp.]|nr:hypothetical protein [Modicisalibacter sp.]
RFELAYLLSGHPAVQDMQQWRFEELSFDFNIQAIAQHYQYVLLFFIPSTLPVCFLNVHPWAILFL